MYGGSPQCKLVKFKSGIYSIFKDALESLMQCLLT